MNGWTLALLLSLSSIAITAIFLLIVAINPPEIENDRDEHQSEWDRRRG